LVGAGSNSHWQNYEMMYLILAGFATPLVLSVHTIVSFDFAVSILARLAYNYIPAILRSRCCILWLCDGSERTDLHQKNIQHGAYNHHEYIREYE
jgi:hypothetical protein